MERYYLSVEEVAKALNVGKGKAYQVIRILNAELQKQGRLTIRGKVNRRYFEAKMINF